MDGLSCTAPELERLVWPGPVSVLLMDVVPPSRQLWEEFCELDGWVGSGKSSDQHLTKPVFFLKCLTQAPGSVPVVPGLSGLLCSPW